MPHLNANNKPVGHAFEVPGGGTQSRRMGAPGSTPRPLGTDLAVRPGLYDCWRSRPTMAFSCCRVIQLFAAKRCQEPGTPLS